MTVIYLKIAGLLALIVYFAFSPKIHAFWAERSRRQRTIKARSNR